MYTLSRSHVLGFSAFLATVSLALVLPRTAKADIGQWGPFESFGNGVSVSFCQVDNNTETWKFRNDTSRTIASMSFNITDSTGVHGDCIPTPLGPGQVFGGWAAYTAVSPPGQRVFLQITNIQWQ